MQWLWRHSMTEKRALMPLHFLKNWPQLAKLADGSETKTRHKRRKDKKKGTKMPVPRGRHDLIVGSIYNPLLDNYYYLKRLNY